MNSSAMEQRSPLSKIHLDAAAFAAHAAKRARQGRIVLWAGSLLFAAVILDQALYAADVISFGSATWRPVLYAYLIWAVALGANQIR